MRYLDAHAHVQFPPYDTDREEVLARMKEEGVGAVVVGVDKSSSERAIELVEGTDDLYASVGLHPNLAGQGFDSEEWKALASHEKVVAIGECGLDYFRPEDAESAKEAQKELFLKHLELAVALDKPLIIHSRPSKGTQDTNQDLIAILAEKKEMYGERLRGLIHFFVGGVPEAQAFDMLGFKLSYTAVITFARDYDESIKCLPLSSITAETDAPYVAPESRRGKRNDPLAVIDVVKKIAEIRGEDEEVVRKVLFENAVSLFNLK